MLTIAVVYSAGRRATLEPGALSVVASSVCLMVDAAQVERWRELLLALAAPDAADGERTVEADAARVELIAALERLKNTASAVQADAAVGLDASQRAQQATAGVPAARQGRGVAAQVALARQTSPHRGRILLGLAKALHTELPCTRAALRAGVIEEYTATLVASETACLPPEQRGVVDRMVLGDPAALDGVGTRRLVGRVRAATIKVSAAPPTPAPTGTSRCGPRRTP